MIQEAAKIYLRALLNFLVGLHDNIYRETNIAKGTIDRNCAAVGRKVRIGDDNKQINIARFDRFTPG